MLTNIILGFLAGLLGTVFMDRIALFIIKRQIFNLPKIQIVPGMLGRWILLFFKSGRLIYPDIRYEKTQPYEIKWGWFFHYVIGSVLGVLFLFLVPASLEDSVVKGFIYGFATNIFPWFVMYPAMGFGLCASRLENQKDLLKLSCLNHLIFGVGLGLAYGYFKFAGG